MLASISPVHCAIGSDDLTSALEGQRCRIGTVCVCAWSGRTNEKLTKEQQPSWHVINIINVKFAKVRQVLFDGGCYK